jgi:DNA-binding winged helix-turn-helix (wHTH) protein
MVQFSVFEVDVRTRELRKQGLRVKLQEKPFKLLLTLLEGPGELVTREELRHRLWSADTYVDFDRSINIAVAKLRLALGDSSESPRFIETLPRRGYRFIAPVTKKTGHSGPVLTGMAINETAAKLATQSPEPARSALRVAESLERTALTDGARDRNKDTSSLVAQLMAVPNVVLRYITAPWRRWPRLFG